MLLTEYGYEASQPAWLSSQLPLQSWRYVGIGTEGPCFLIDRGPSNPSTAKLLRACLVTSPEQLREDLLNSAGRGDYRVYIFDFSDSHTSESQLVPLLALYSYVVADATWFSYMTHDGKIHPCMPSQPAPTAAAEWAMEWAEGWIPVMQSESEPTAVTRQLRAK
ncbi:hypothetical protein [Ralstonia chuxiongensis]|uniref:hypothetical protein n=1 Tax=Ralstonia chuxiongensis TaxID=2957504 RepID=UPI0028F6194E|nr:hypothetical protein [Ralstonia chuxiongensis]CAJ0774580.1 hypothetical protein R8510_03943 [Ralstonia chuxiongensis]